ncbi:MAG: polysaccharide deacetylase family protein [Bacteroidales bacterium]|nr:polysaccharide deacetylase family protein [Bacteroidales bacterium]
MLLIYTEKVTSRVKYIFGVFFDDLLGVPYEITNDAENYQSFEGPKMAYSRQKPEEGTLFFQAKELLFERDINSPEIEFVDYKGVKGFFPVYDPESCFPFDMFSAAFFLLSRYEEYLPYRKDEHGRFPAKESLAFQKEFLNIPIVNIWANQFAEILKQNFPELKTKKHKYSFLPTIDVDVAFAYTLRGPVRLVGAFVKSLLRFDVKDLLLRFKVLFRITEDPFDTYTFILDLHKRYGLKTIFFILFGSYGQYDKNIATTKSKFHVMIKHLSDFAEVGIHPSYDSNDSFDRLKRELRDLSRVVHKDIEKSRQHFLKIQLPQTYRNLASLGIKDDYTMGYADAVGFRAGICTAFYFYDLDMDKETRLRIHPFAVMEGTLKDYLNVPAEKGMSVIAPLIDQIKAVDGTFISLWHNETLSEQTQKAWRRLYIEMLKYALPEKK